jgi:tetratricopeptide (TPR) repeat protein
MSFLTLSLSLAGQFEAWVGTYAEAARLQAESLQIAREHNLLIPLLVDLFRYGLTLTAKGDYDAGLGIFEEGLSLSEKVGDEVYRQRLLNSMGWLHIEVGDLNRAFDLNRRRAEGAYQRGDHEPIANAEINLGYVFLAKGDLSLAQEVLEGVHGLVNDPATSEWQRWRYSIHLFASLGELWLARGETVKAREFAEQRMELATHTNSRKYLVKGWRLQGEIALAHGRWDEAESMLRQALVIAQAIGDPAQFWKTLFVFGRLYTEANRPEQAQQACHAAREIIDQVKANLQNPGLRASLENSSMVRHVYDLSAPS